MTIEISFPLLNPNEPEALLASLYVSEDQVGFRCIVKPGALVSHDYDLDEVVNISPGAILAGEVQVWARALLEIGITVNLQAKIGAARALATARL